MTKSVLGACSRSLDVLASGDVIADVHERDGVIEMLLDRLELRSGGAFEMLVGIMPRWMEARSPNSLLPPASTF